MRVPGNSSTASSLFTSSSASAVAASASALSAVSSTAFTSSTASAAAVASSAAAVASSLTAAQHPAEASAAVVVERNPYALVLALIPVLTIFGNSMVILAVRKEKSLQTVTNYLIVSLASADLLVATCVMFFAVYFEFNSFVWDLGPTLCNLYIGADVACSTASILNLLAISIDRYIAISHPLAYCQIGTSSRAYLSIALVWFVSIMVAVPLAFGANHISDEHDCSFTNPVFMISSSVLSFFMPCLAMIALYAVIFRRLREREKARDMRKRGFSTLGVENALVLNALMGGARMARQIAKSHLKDQLLLELSLQTSSFPSPSEEEEEEEEEDMDQSESEASTQPASRAHKKPSSCRPSSGGCGQKLSTSVAHKLSSSLAPGSHAGSTRRPTFCLMMNGSAGGPMPFPLAPMNPLSLPRSAVHSGEEDDDKDHSEEPLPLLGARRRPSGQRRRNSRNKRRAALVLRRCNTLPSAVLRRPLIRVQGAAGSGGGSRQMEKSLDGDPEARIGAEEGALVTVQQTDELDDVEQCNLEEQYNPGEQYNDCKQYIAAMPLALEPMMGHHPLVSSLELLGNVAMGPSLNRPCSASASQFSLRESLWHGADDNGSALSTQRSFGDGLQQMFPFIDLSVSSVSSPSSSSSGTSSSGGSSSSVDGDESRKWSSSAMTDPTASKSRRRTTSLLEKPPRAHSSYCGWPEGVPEPIVVAEPLGEEEELEQEAEARDVEEAMEAELAEQPTGRPRQVPLIHFATPEHHWRRHGFQQQQQQQSDQNNNNQLPLLTADMETEDGSPKKRHLSTTVRPRLSLACPAACCQSLPNLAGAESRLGSPLPREEAAVADANGRGGMGDWIRGILLDWPRQQPRKQLAEEGAENSTAAAERSTTAAGSDPLSASIGNRSVRIAASSFGRGSRNNASATYPAKPSTHRQQQRNGSCPQQQQLHQQQQPSSAKSSSHQSPLQRIRNAFRRSLLAAMDEKRRPSRQLLKRATKQMRREQKATVTLAVVLAVFLCCWVPFFALHLSNALCLLTGGQQCVHFLVMFFATWLGFLNSSLNPLIYTVFDKRFRKAFRDLLSFCLGPTGGGGIALNRAGRARQRC